MTNILHLHKLFFELKYRNIFEIYFEIFLHQPKFTNKQIDRKSFFKNFFL